MPKNESNLYGLISLRKNKPLLEQSRHPKLYRCKQKSFDCLSETTISLAINACYNGLHIVAFCCLGPHISKNDSATNNALN